MEHIGELELSVAQTFARQAECLPACSDDRARAQALLLEINGLIEQVQDVAAPRWSESARLIQTALATLHESDDAGAFSCSAQANQELAKLVADGLEALGAALDDSPEAHERLQSIHEELGSRWGFQAHGPPTSESVPSTPSDSEPETASAPMDRDQLQLILSTLDSGSSTSEESDRENECPPDTGSRNQSLPGPEVTNGPASQRPGQSPCPPVPGKITIDPALIEAFMEDASQCLAAMERIVVDDQRMATAQLPEASRLIRRELHTLKGASASIELSSLASYLHDVEEWLETPGQSHSASQLRESVFECVDAVRRHIAAAQGGSTATATNVSQADPALATNAGTAFHDSAQTNEATLRVKTSQVDRLMDLLAGLAMLRARRDGRATEFAASLEQLVRSVNRLRSLAEDVSLGHEGDSPAGKAEAESLRLRLKEVASDLEESIDGFKLLQEPLEDENRSISRFVGEFRQELVQLRRLPLAGLFRRLQRAAFDAARSESKEVRFDLLGEHSGLERSLQERLYEPLLHMVRNAVSHGVESAAERVKAGKDPVGTVTLEASGSSHVLILELADDGRGLDYEAIRRRGLERGLIPADRPVSQQELARLIFHPGFSTRDTTTGVSGRGVGMDIVASALERLHCLLEIDSRPGQGTRFRMTIPLYSIIEHVMVFRSGGRLFGVPMNFVKSASDSAAHRHSPASEHPVRTVEATQLLRLPRVARTDSGRKLVLGLQRGLSQGTVSTRSSTDSAFKPLRDLVLVVDEIVGPEEIVVRPLPPLLKHHPFLSGVTVSGRGEILQLLDCHRLIRSVPVTETPDAPETTAATSVLKPLWSVLVTDDSLSARRRLINKLQPYGVKIVEAADGLEALERIREQSFDILFTDLEMERMNGFDLLAEIQHAETGNPERIVMVTSRTEPAIRHRAKQLGAQMCLAKPISEQDLRAVMDQFQACRVSR